MNCIYDLLIFPLKLYVFMNCLLIVAFLIKFIMDTLIPFLFFKFDFAKHFQMPEMPTLNTYIFHLF